MNTYTATKNPFSPYCVCLTTRSCSRDAQPITAMLSSELMRFSGNPTSLRLLSSNRFLTGPHRRLLVPEGIMNDMHLDEEIRVTMQLDAKDPGLATHFPGAPTVPGSVVTMALVRLAVQHLGPVESVGSMSFRHSIAPGDMEAFLKTNGNVVHCTVTQKGRTCVRGVLYLTTQTDGGGDA